MGFRDIYNKVKAMPKMTLQQAQRIKKAALSTPVRIGTYKDQNVSASIGGSIGKRPRQIGGTIGIDRRTKRPFGSYNINSKIKGKFGPQE